MAEDRDWHWYKRNDYIREPVLWGVSFCIADQLYDPFSGKQLPNKKSDFVYVLIIIDFTVIFMMVWFINNLET